MFIPPEDKIMNPGTVWHGTALGWSKVIDMYVSKIPIVSHRFCGVKFCDKKRNINCLIYCAYLPTRGQDDDFRDTVTHLEFDINQNKDTDSCILLGIDSNCSNTSTMRRRSLFEDTILNNLSMVTILPDDSPTFHHNNGTSQSKIDDIYHSIPETSECQINFSQLLCKLADPLNMSPHDVIVGSFLFPEEKANDSDEEHLNSKYEQFINKKIKWNPSLIQTYEDMLPDLCDFFFKDSS